MSSSTVANTNTMCSSNGFQGKKRKPDDDPNERNGKTKERSLRRILKEISSSKKLNPENLNQNIITEEDENGLDLSLSLAPPNRNDGGDTSVEWTITKELTRSDVVSQQNRLLITREEGKRHILNYLDNDEQQKVYDHGCPITLVDIDTQDEIKLKFRYWKSNKSYSIIGKWHKLVVTRRGLEKEKKEGIKLATVGLRWDVDNKKLLFSVLKD